MKNILITGGTGLVGRALTSMLQQSGYEVTHLSRQKSTGGIRTCYWNIQTGEMDPSAITGVDYIIHLAGASVAGHRWTAAYKNTILESRVKSAELLYSIMEENPNTIKAVISASAIGYYGERGDQWLHEYDPPANDFLGVTCQAWEASVARMAALNKRVAILRTGIVLAREGGALPPLINPLRFGVLPVFGNGSQYYPWIHIQDLCSMYLHAIEHEGISGAYNACAPEPARYMDLMEALAAVMGKIKIHIPVPMAILRLLMGDFVNTLYMSTRCSSQKMTATGFEFSYPQLKKALQDLTQP